MKQNIHYFAFYPQDFLIGTIGMTNHQVGIYIKLICLQFDRGPLELQIIQQYAEGIQEDIDAILRKFKCNKKGLYYNERLEDVRKKANESHEKFKKFGSQGGKIAQENKLKNKGGSRVPTSLPNSVPTTTASNSTSEQKGIFNTSKEPIESQTLDDLYKELYTEGE